MLLGALTALAPGALAPGAGAAQEDRICTLVGCSSGVRVTFERLPRVATRPGVRMTVCGAGRCVVDEDLRFGVHLDAPVGGVQPVRVVVVFRDAGGRVLWRRERVARAAGAFRPNGPDCPPTCWTVRLAVDGAHLRVEKRIAQWEEL